MPQENNMAEVVRLLQNVIVKVDALTGDVHRLDVKFNRLEGKVDSLEGKVDRLEGKVDRLEGRVGRVEGKLDLLSGQFQEVATLVIKDSQGLTTVETRVDVLEGRSH